MKKGIRLMLWILIPLIPIVLIFIENTRKFPDGVNYYTYTIDLWSLVHIIAGFLISFLLWYLGVPHDWNLPIVGTMGLLFEPIEHFIFENLANNGGIEAWPNIFVDIILVAIGGLLWVIISPDPVQPPKSNKRKRVN